MLSPALNDLASGAHRRDVNYTSTTDGHGHSGASGSLVNHKDAEAALAASKLAHSDAAAASAKASAALDCGSGWGSCHLIPAGDICPSPRLALHLNEGMRLRYIAELAQAHADACAHEAATRFNVISVDGASWADDLKTYPLDGSELQVCNAVRPLFARNCLP